MKLVLLRDQVCRIDDLAVGKYRIPGLLPMENAGRNAASIIDRLYAPKGRAFGVADIGAPLESIDEVAHCPPESPPR